MSFMSISRLFADYKILASNQQKFKLLLQADVAIRWESVYERHLFWEIKWIIITTLLILFVERFTVLIVGRTSPKAEKSRYQTELKWKIRGTNVAHWMAKINFKLLQRHIWWILFCFLTFLREIAGGCINYHLLNYKLFWGNTMNVFMRIAYNLWKRKEKILIFTIKTEWLSSPVQAMY